MLKPYIDLHLHSTQSDGALTPQQLIDQARKAGIHVLAITDHNTTMTDLTGLRVANPDMQLIQGMEISCRYILKNDQEVELHIIGLGFDPLNKRIQQVITHNQPDRRPYVNAILSSLAKYQIYIGNYDDLCNTFPESRHIGRMQIARAMQEKGYVKNIDEAFDIYIGSFGEKKAFVENPLQFVSLEEAVAAILDAGGIPVLCHLHHYHLDADAEEALVKYFKKLAEDKAALEVFYSRYSSEQRLPLLRLCQKYRLMPSAASDFHGQNKSETLENRFSYASCSKILNCLGITLKNAIPCFPITILSGFSGCGKGTVLKQFIQEKRYVFGCPLGLITSCTTRKQRSPNENYHFLSPSDFQKLVDTNQLLEYNEAYSNHSYGTPIKGVLEAVQAGSVVCLEIDRTGVQNLLTGGRVDPDQIIPVFLVASAKDVYDRLCMRNTETLQEIKKRLNTALVESGYIHSLYPFILVNDNLYRVTEQLEKAFNKELDASDEFDTVQFQIDIQQIITTL